MAWPSNPVSVGDIVTATQLNLLPIQIGDSTLSGTAASFDFTSIPSWGSSLLLVLYLRGSVAAASVGWTVRFNADSGSNYDFIGMGGNSSSVSVAETFGSTGFGIGTVPGSSAPANVFGGLIIEIPHYANSINNKVAFFKGADKRGTSAGSLVTRSDTGFWRSNSAINEVTVLPASSTWAAGCRATMYLTP